MDAAREWKLRDVAEVVRLPTALDHKSSRGIVELRTGSADYPGAAVLSVEGAWRAGAGYVRWVGDAEPARGVLARRPETVLGEGRAHARVWGSGQTAELAERVAPPDDGTPLVVDAGALGMTEGRGRRFVVTPHAGEFARLAHELGVGEDATPRGARALARALGGVVLLKGFETFVATAEDVYLARSATPWLATAGAGDVLAGVIGAVLAQESARRGEDPLSLDELARCAVSAAVLHGMAARIAAGVLRTDGSETGRSGHPIVASDVAAAVPHAVALALA